MVEAVHDRARQGQQRSLWEGFRASMSNIFSFGDPADEDELALETPDETEATDLRRHATRCSSRYRILRRGQRSQDGRLRRIEFLLAAIFLLAVIAKFGAVEGFKTFMGM
jgi:hypothetical protein